MTRLWALRSDSHQTRPCFRMRLVSDVRPACQSNDMAKLAGPHKHCGFPVFRPHKSINKITHIHTHTNTHTHTHTLMEHFLLLILFKLLTLVTVRTLTLAALWPRSTRSLVGQFLKCVKLSEDVTPQRTSQLFVARRGMTVKQINHPLHLY